MNDRRKRLILMLIGFLLSVAAVVIFVRVLRGEWPKVKAVLTQSPGRVLAGSCWSVVAIAVYYGCRIARLRLLLCSSHSVSWRAATHATLLGFMANCVLPLRAGELIRPYVLHKQSDVGLAEAFGTAMGLERTLDLIGLCVLFLVTWLLLRSTVVEVTSLAVNPDKPLTLPDVWDLGRIMVFVAAVGLAGLALLAFVPAPMLRLAAWLTRPFPQRAQQAVHHLTHGVVAAMRTLRSPSVASLALLLSLAQWTALVLSTYLVARGLGVRLSLEAVLLIQLVTTLFVAPPQAPAFVGMFQLGVLFGAELMQIDTATAGALSLLMWVVNVIPVTLAGLIVLWCSGWSLGQLARESRSASTEEAD